MANEKVIGFPRGLTYYTHFPFWYGFFKALGIEVVVSDKTTKETVSSGAALVVTETCLPIKIYVGHVINLINKGITKIFVPSIQSIAPKIYNCSKIRGLPDLIRNVIKQDFELIEPTLDKSEKGKDFYNFLSESVKSFGITDFDIIKKASKAGWELYNNFLVMARSEVPYKKAFKNALEGNIVLDADEKEYPISVAIASHDYNIFDEHASMKIFDKLNKMGVKVYCSINLTNEKKLEGLSTLEQKKMYWANELEINGTAGHYLTENKIDGIITLNSFGCGPDSLMVEKITRKAKEFGKPLLVLTIDEHTGEAGFVTRLEAFIDMLYRKKRKQITKNSDIEEYTPNTSICDKVI